MDTRKQKDTNAAYEHGPDGAVQKWKFKDREDLVDYVGRTFDIAPISPGILRGTAAQLRAAATQLDLRDRRVQFSEPVLDLITSTNGELEIDGMLYDLRDDFLRERRGDRNIEVFALNCTDDFPSGFERCESDDGKKIIFRSGPSSITFRAFRSSNWGYWKAGAEITTQGPDFEAAQIDSRYFFPAHGQVCATISDSDSDTNDDFLDEYEWGLFSESPKRVVSLCRVQWNGRRIAGIVSVGTECFASDVEPFPDGYPEDWPPLGPTDPIGSVSVSPRALSFGSRPERPTVTKSVLISNSHAVPKVVTVDNVEVSDPSIGTVPAFGTFANTIGEFTVPPNGSVQIAISFTGISGFGSIEGRLPISWDGQLVNVSLTGMLLQVIGR